MRGTRLPTCPRGRARSGMPVRSRKVFFVSRFSFFSFSFLPSPETSRSRRESAQERDFEPSRRGEATYSRQVSPVPRFESPLHAASIPSSKPERRLTRALRCVASERRRFPTSHRHSPEVMSECERSIQWSRSARALRSEGRRRSACPPVRRTPKARRSRFYGQISGIFRRASVLCPDRAPRICLSACPRNFAEVPDAKHGSCQNQGVSPAMVVSGESRQSC